MPLNTIETPVLVHGARNLIVFVDKHIAVRAKGQDTEVDRVDTTDTISAQFHAAHAGFELQRIGVHHGSVMLTHETIVLLRRNQIDMSEHTRVGQLLCSILDSSCIIFCAG